MLLQELCPQNPTLQVNFPINFHLFISLFLFFASILRRFSNEFSLFSLANEKDEQMNNTPAPMPPRKFKPKNDDPWGGNI